MDPRIEELKTTTFSGRRLSRRQLSEIQETVALVVSLVMPIQFPRIAPTASRLTKTTWKHSIL